MAVFFGILLSLIIIQTCLGYHEFWVGLKAECSFGFSVKYYLVAPIFPSSDQVDKYYQDEKYEEVFATHWFISKIPD